MKYLYISLIITISLNAEMSLREKAFSKGLRATPQNLQELIKEVDDKNNPLTVQKIKLGKKLFFDKNLSFDRTIACASCHDIKKGGEDSIPTAIGYKNQENPKHLNTPTVLDTAYSKHLFWDGRANSLREQAKGPIQAHFEMASTPKLVQERVKENIEYKSCFENVFGKDSITFDNVTKAIAAYEKTLVTSSRYDKFLNGDDNALSKEEKHGLNLFIEMGCKACHFGTGVGGQKIQKFPLRNYNSFMDLTTYFNEEDGSRTTSHFRFNFKEYQPYPFKNIGGFMGKDDSRKFRVPILRNISKTAPYFHNGVVKTLKEAIEIMAKEQLGLDLTKKQLNDLEAFLKSLDGQIVKF
jgi:cytochrome c peroxidase